jgi:hypothetical protein
MPTVDRYSSDAPAECDVAIVGGGFSGLMSLVRLAQCAPKSFERADADVGLQAVAAEVRGRVALLRLPVHGERHVRRPHLPRGAVPKKHPRNADRGQGR